MAKHMRISLVIDALAMASDHGHLDDGAVFHSDRVALVGQVPVVGSCGGRNFTMGALGSSARQRWQVQV